MDTAERVGVVGGGQMGGGIAEVCARAGLDVVVREVDEVAAGRARDRMEQSFERATSKGRLSEADRDSAWSRLRFTTAFDEFADRTVVIEAVVENEDEKVAVFRRLDDVVAARDAVLASNTSSIPIMRLARETRRPEAVIGMHFFNPVPVLGLVELVPCLTTSQVTKERAHRLAADVLGKHPIWCADRAGFVVNALLVPYLLSAIRMVEAGVATAEDVDAGMVEGCAHPMGPLALTDLIGLDTTKAVAESLYAEYAEPLYAPPPLLARMVEAGWLGRKTGRGFYDYGDR